MSEKRGSENIENPKIFKNETKNYNFIIGLFHENGILFENKTIKILSKTNLIDSDSKKLRICLKIINKSNKLLDKFGFVITGDSSNK